MDKLPFLQAAWPNPKQSVGDFIGSKKGIMGTNNCWKLKTPVEDHFKSILEQVKLQLQEAGPHVPSAAPLGYDIFMIGKTPERSKPYIMFHCRKKEPREKAMEAIKGGQLLKDHPGLEVGHWRFPPDAPNLQASTQDDPPDDLHSGSEPLFSTQNYQLIRIDDPEEQAGPPAEIPSLQRPLGLLVQLRRRGLPDTERAATAALSISHAGQLYLLTTAHAFVPPDDVAEESEAGDTEDDDDDDWVLSGDQEPEPGVDLHTITEIEEERLVSTTSDGSRTPPPDAPAGSWTDMDPDESSTDLSTESGLEPDEVVPPPPMPMPPPPGKEEPIDKEQGGQSSGTFDYCALVNTSLDYALLAVSPALTHHFQELRSDTVLSIDASTIEVARTQNWPLGQKCDPNTLLSITTEVVTTNQAGASKNGVLENRPTYMRLPYGDSFEAVYPVRLAEPPEKGDSGAAVVEKASGKILGHIVVASLEASTVYIIPATKVLADIQTRAEVLVPEDSSTELKIASAAQQANVSNLERLKISSIASDSGYTSIPSVVGQQPSTVPEQSSSEAQQLGPSRVTSSTGGGGGSGGRTYGGIRRSREPGNNFSGGGYATALYHGQYQGSHGPYTDPHALSTSYGQSSGGSSDARYTDPYPPYSGHYPQSTSYVGSRRGSSGYHSLGSDNYGGSVSYEPSAYAESRHPYREYISSDYTASAAARGSTTVVQHGRSSYGSNTPTPRYGGEYRR